MVEGQVVQEDGVSEVKKKVIGRPNNFGAVITDERRSRLNFIMEDTSAQYQARGGNYLVYLKGIFLLLHFYIRMKLEKEFT